MMGHKTSGMKQKSVQDLGVLGHFAKTDVLLATDDLAAGSYAQW